MLENRKILITGSSDGIGKSISKLLLNSGAQVIGIAREHSKFRPKNSNYFDYTIDLSNKENLEKMILNILSEHKNIDGFVSNAGYGLFGNLETFSSNDISNYIFTNLTSHIIITSHIIPRFNKQKKGNIIFIGSDSALAGGKNGSIYSAAKFGLRGFSQSIRKECSSKNIHVSLINPGMVRTSFFKNKNFQPGDEKTNAIEPDDIAQLVINILSMREGSVIDEINLSPLKKVIKFL